MKILISTPHFYPMISGVTLRIKMITDHFINNNHKVTIITPYKNANRKYKGIDIHTVKSRPLSRMIAGKNMTNVLQYDFISLE